MAETNKKKVIGRCLVSLISTFVTQLSLFTIPCFFPSAPLPTLLALSVVVLLGLTVIGRCCKRVLRVRASAPAFVFLNVVFNWGVYFGFIRQVITPRVDFLLNIEFLMLVIGLCRMLSTDPGYATNCSSNVPKLVENHASAQEAEGCDSRADEYTADERVRYCTHCKAYVRGFDHHCPAFGNCIGQENHVLFIMLLIGFICTESSYVACSLRYSANLQILDKNEHVGLFLAWHIYCVCFNIKTDEWINWKKYPEFHVIVNSEPGKVDPESSITFRNPYDKGLMQNLREFLVNPN